MHIQKAPSRPCPVTLTTDVMTGSAGTLSGTHQVLTSSVCPAGMATELVVTFRPSENVDIVTAIPLLASTGPILVPVRCLTKKVNISVTPAAVAFGPQPATLGDTQTQTFVISNDGALLVDYVISVLGDFPERETSIRKGLVLDSSERDAMPLFEEMKVFLDEQTCELEAGPFTLRRYMGQVPGYSRAAVRASFAPVGLGARQATLRLSFKAVERKSLVIEPVNVVLEVRSECIDQFLHLP